jgi:hypothetical protein
MEGHLSTLKNLGSAEPLTADQRAERLRQLAAWGVDLSLSSAQLGKSPSTCLQEWLAFRSFVEAAQHAVGAGHVRPHRPR